MERRSDDDLERIVRETRWVYDLIETYRNQIDAGTHPNQIMPQLISVHNVVMDRKTTALVMFNNCMKLNHELTKLHRIFEDCHIDIANSGNHVPWHMNRDLDVCRNMRNDYGVGMNVASLSYDIEDICDRELTKFIEELE